MEYPLDTQIRQLILSVLLGCALGLAYDLFRAPRRRFGHRWLTALLDILFSLLAAFMLFYFGMGPGEGAVPVLMLAFAGAGFGAYMAFVRHGC